MNHLLKITGPLLSLLGGSCLFILPSCEGNHFANPLPVNSKNIYQVPSGLRGRLTNYKDSTEIYFLEKNSITIPAKGAIKIINGIWFHPSDTATSTDTVKWKKILDYPTYESRYSVKFDSLHHPIDTVENYVIKRNKIYKILSDGIGPGDPYTLTGDTIYVTPVPRKIILGNGAFFRKVTDDLYVINIRDSELEIGTINWWQIRLLEKRKDGKIILYDWSKEIISDSTLIYTKADHHYFDSQWTKRDMLRLLSEEKLEPVNLKK
ncbi:MAG: hypothetical protein KBF45_11025 [Cyclobacteriaceae bacterium]|jgi:hypothetical protein|nr:hypothetical protein [Cyclobacteriaceae bacterium]